MQRDPAASPRNQSHFVGRDVEMDELRGVLDRTASGAAHVALIEGEPGIGKSRLLEEVLQEAQSRGFQALRGGADELERNRPFRALVEAFSLKRGSTDVDRAAIGALLWNAPGGDKEAASDVGFRVTELILDLVERLATEAPVVLGIEDLHWADTSTLRTVRAIATRLTQLPVALLVTLRPVPQISELTRVIADIAGGGATHLMLEPLGKDAAAGLAADVVDATPGPRLAEYLTGAHGNPLYIIELLRALADDQALRVEDGLAEVPDALLPTSFRTAVMRRINFLPEETLELLRLGCLLGSHFLIEDLSIVSGTSAIELRPHLQLAIRTGLLGDEGERLGFRHDLIRESIYNDLPASVRKGMHREAGRRLTAVGRPVEQIADQVALGAGAGDMEAVGWLRRSAREIASRSPLVAVGLLERALEIAPELAPERAKVVADLTRLLPFAGRGEDAERLARDTLERGTTPAIEIELRRALGDILQLRGQMMAALEQIQLAADAAGMPEDVRRTISPHLLIFLTELDAARTGTERELRQAQDTGNALAEAWALASLARVYYYDGRLEKAFEAGTRSISLARRSSHHLANYVLSAARLQFATLLGDLGRYEEGLALLEEGRRATEDRGLTAWLPVFHAETGWLRFFCGDWDDTVAEAEVALRLSDEVGTRYNLYRCYAMLASVALHRGHLDAAAHRLDEADRTFEAQGFQYQIDWVLWTRALWLESHGRIPEATNVIVNAWSVVAPYVVSDVGCGVAQDGVRLMLRNGDRVGAEALAAVMDEQARLVPGQAPIEAAARRCRGLLEDDPDILLASVSAFRKTQRSFNRAQACHDAASALARAGRHREAVEVLEEALVEYERLAAVPHIARAESDLRALGVRRGRRGARPRATVGWESLTKTEGEIVRLVAEGLRNRQVAERLFISPRTVETHLSHVFGKLTISTRGELVGEAVRRGLSPA